MEFGLGRSSPQTQISAAAKCEKATQLRGFMFVWQMARQSE